MASGLTLVCCLLSLFCLAAAADWAREPGYTAAMERAARAPFNGMRGKRYGQDMDIYNGVGLYNKI